MLRGAERLLSGPTPPLVVFEANAEFFGAAGTSYAAVVGWLCATGYALWAMRRDGLRRESPAAERPGSLNVLAAREDHAPHAALLDRLSRLRFPASQNA